MAKAKAEDGTVLKKSIRWINHYYFQITQTVANSNVHPQKVSRVILCLTVLAEDGDDYVCEGSRLGNGKHTAVYDQRIRMTAGLKAKRPKKPERMTPPVAMSRPDDQISETPKVTQPRPTGTSKAKLSAAQKPRRSASSATHRK